MKKRITGFFVLLYLLAPFLHAQDPVDLSSYKEKFKLSIAKTNETVKIDGLFDEAVWQKADKADQFWQKYPRDDVKAAKKTEVKLTYDNNFLYVAAWVYDPVPFISQSLKRDSRIRENDGLGIILDPMNKKTSGFYFTVTAYNVQADDLLSVNNFDELSFSWDHKWYSATKRYADHYTIEMAIPFKTLRYDKDNQQWGINFIRSDRKANEFHTWTRIPVNFPGVDIGYLGALNWDAPPPKPGTNISLIPYITGEVKENREDNEKMKANADAGFDAKLALSSSLNLDLTVNPDFSQVEVDRQVTNLSRFNIFFPERRNFFLENSDLFSEYGIPPIRPFYSRRIGLDPNGNTIPIWGGARLTGSVAPKTRIGIMSMQTKATKDYAAQNYSAVTMQQQLLKRSTFKAYMFNRQGFFNEEHKLTDPLDEYGRNAGGEFFFNNSKGEWQGWLGYHHSMKPGVKSKNSYLNAGGGYFGRKVTSFVNVDNVGNNYYADMGFIERIENYDALRDSVFRVGFRQLFNENSYTIYPEKGRINRHKWQLENFVVFNPDGTLNERANAFTYMLDFRNTSRVEIAASNQETKLLYHTSFTDGNPLPPGAYHYNQLAAEYNTDSRKNIVFMAGVETGKYFNGKYLQLEGGITLRKQPGFTLDITAEYNKLRFPGSYGQTELFLLQSRAEINFSNALFWTTFIQYNTQRNNININSRLQWRYKPASDFFLVYTDNYFTDPFLKNKNRALVFKLNYWLNL